MTYEFPAGFEREPLPEFMARNGMRRPVDSDIAHLDGVPWFEAPKPFRWHRCKTQTMGWFGLELVRRCACGAIRCGRERTWIDRNSRRRK